VAERGGEDVQAQADLPGSKRRRRDKRGVAVVFDAKLVLW